MILWFVCLFLLFGFILMPLTFSKRKVPNTSDITRKQQKKHWKRNNHQNGWCFYVCFQTTQNKIKEFWHSLEAQWDFAKSQRSLSTIQKDKEKQKAGSFCFISQSEHRTIEHSFTTAALVISVQNILLCQKCICRTHHRTFRSVSQSQPEQEVCMQRWVRNTPQACLCLMPKSIQNSSALWRSSNTDCTCFGNMNYLTRWDPAEARHTFDAIYHCRRTTVPHQNLLLVCSICHRNNITWICTCTSLTRSTRTQYKSWYAQNLQIDLSIHVVRSFSDVFFRMFCLNFWCSSHCVHARETATELVRQTTFLQLFFSARKKKIFSMLR